MTACCECGCPNQGQINVTNLGILCKCCMDMLLVILNSNYMLRMHGEWKKEQRRIASESD